MCQSLTLGKLKLYGTLKATSEMKNQWLHCSKGSMKWKQHKVEINKAMRWCGSDF